MSTPDPFRPCLLLTRPEERSRHFAAACADLPLRIVIAPLQRIVPVPHDPAPLEAAETLVLTSVEAVPFAGPGRGRLAFCVGPATAAAARAAGFAVAVSATGEAEGLAAIIDRPALHPHGRHLARDLGVEGVVVYDQVAQPLPPAGRAVLEGDAPVVLPLFSPRSARLAAEAAREARAPLHPIAISANAADAWAQTRAEVPLVAETPDAEGILAALHRWLEAGTFGAEDGLRAEGGPSRLRHADQGGDGT